jgi:hypothetical protein
MSGDESVVPEATSPERSDWRVTGGSSGTTFILPGSTLKCLAHANSTWLQVLFGTEPIGFVVSTAAGVLPLSASFLMISLMLRSSFIIVPTGVRPNLAQPVIAGGEPIQPPCQSPAAPDASAAPPFGKYLIVASMPFSLK